MLAGTNANVATSDAAARVSTMLAQQRDGGVRLTKPMTREAPTYPVTRQRAFPIPKPEPDTSSLDTEPEQAFTGVSALIHKWQTQA